MRGICSALLPSWSLFGCLFTTLFLAILNLEKNSLTYCNAGHNPALLQRSDGSIEELGASASAEMRAGDSFVILTPGGGGFGEVSE